MRDRDQILLEQSYQRIYESDERDAEIVKAVQKGIQARDNIIDKDGVKLSLFELDDNKNNVIEGKDYNYKSEGDSDSLDVFFLDKKTGEIKYEYRDCLSGGYKKFLAYIKNSDGSVDAYDTTYRKIQTKVPNEGVYHYTYKNHTQLLIKVIFRSYDGSSSWSEAYDYDDAGRQVYYRNKKGELWYWKYLIQGGSSILKLITAFRSEETDINYDYYIDTDKIKNRTTFNRTSGICKDEKFYNDGKTLKSIRYTEQKSIYGSGPVLKDEVYWDNGKLKYSKDYESGEVKNFDQNGNLLKPVPGEEDLYGMDPDEVTAFKKARTYNRQYGGMFLHALSPHQLPDLLSLTYEEVCVSTVRSNTVFRDPAKSLVLIGFGDIRLLYDFDVYSEIIPRTGKRVATKIPKQTEHLHDIDVSAVSDYVDSKYYDEGIMSWESADILLASVPQDVFKTFMSKKINLIKQLRSTYPGIKIIKPENFEKIKSSEQLLRILYKIKDDRDSVELMKEPLHKYEESINILDELP